MSTEMTNPLVSVIMSVFNEERYVRAAIESILEQTYQNFELIIVDDYSTDRSLEICASIEDPRVRIYSKTDEPRRLAASRNIAIRMAQELRSDSTVEVSNRDKVSMLVLFSVSEQYFLLREALGLQIKV